MKSDGDVFGLNENQATRDSKEVDKLCGYFAFLMTAASKKIIKYAHHTTRRFL